MDRWDIPGHTGDSDLKDPLMKLVVLGAGESGLGAALLGKAKGWTVFVSDFGQIDSETQNVLTKNEIEWEMGAHTDARLLEADLVVKSPGIPEKAAPIQLLRKQGISVISEIEFASRYTDQTVVAITGSNGKTTTTSLTHFLLKEGGLNVAMGGNIGNSFAGLLLDQPASHFVLEVSSFQLDDIEQFKPHIAVITNITPDHLDRYGYSFEAYRDAKFKISQNQTEADYLIYDGDDPNIAAGMKDHTIRAKKLPFSLERPLEEGAYIDDKNIIITIANNQINMPIASLGLQGQHNLKNAMAAATVATLLDIRKETIRQSLTHFQGVEHRLESVLKINNVQYINDSKATNVNATYYALESMETPTVWIVGGVDKGNDYSELLPLINEKVKAVICLGIDNSKLIDSFGNVVDLLVETTSMQDAVNVAYHIAERGDTVLLSPACASFDLFKNYEDRGRQFKEAVRSL